MYRVTKHTRRIAVYVITVIISLLTSSSSAQMLIIQVKQKHNTLDIEANLARETKNYTIPEKSAIIQKLERIHYLLEQQKGKVGTVDKASQFVKRQYRTIREFIPQWKSEKKKEVAVNQTPMTDEIRVLLTEVGQSLYHPVDSFIDRAAGIEFVITEECLVYPFDATYYQGTPLFLHKPIIYSFDRKDSVPLVVSKDWKGFMISDVSTDPERGVLIVKALFPQSRYFDSHDVHLEDIQRMELADFVLISANGGVDGINLPHFAIRPMSLSHMQPKLIYFDSGQFGLRLDFLHSLQQAGTLYYTAPILSNEVGDSSKKTMERFFRAILNGETPSYALFLTRKTLYEHYIYQGDEFSKVMWRAFPFRVYRLN